MSTKPNSLMGRIERFFDDNPNEILTYDDMEIKFGCTRQQAQGAVAHLRNRGAVATAQVVMRAKVEA